MPSDHRRPHGFRDRLLDILDNIALIEGFLTGLGRDQFLEDTRTYYATLRALEIISEASRHLPPDMLERHPMIPWRAVRDSGNVYRHGYNAVSPGRVWDTATQDLGALAASIREELKSLPE